MNKFSIVFIIAIATYGENFFNQLSSPLGIGSKCSNSIDAFVVSSFDVDPFPPKKGASIHNRFTGKFNRPEIIIGIHVEVAIDGINISSENLLASGTYSTGEQATFSFSETLPSFVPSGSYTLKVGLLNLEEEQINCWEFYFNV